MAAPNNYSASLALCRSARNAARNDEDPELAGGGVFNFVQQSSRREPLAPDCGDLALGGQQVVVAGPTLTSIELLEFINSQRGAGESELRHDHFMAKVPKVLGVGAPKFRDTYLHPQNGRQYHCYRFPKREACLMAMSYSYELQAKVFDRMTQLEQITSAPALPDFTDPAAAAVAWAQQFRAKQVLALENAAKTAELAAVQPKANAWHRIAIETEGSVSPRVAAKLAQVPERQFIAFLLEQRWLYRQREGGGLLGYADKQRAGLVEMKRVEVQEADGRMKVVARVLLTQRGIAGAAELIERKAPHLRKTPDAAVGHPAQLTTKMSPTGEPE